MKRMTCIKKHAKNWELHRIAAVDRNILRLAIYEMLHRDDIPPVVSINEAVDIAKKFSTPGQRQVRQRHPRQDQGRADAPGADRQMMLRRPPSAHPFFRRHLSRPEEVVAQAQRHGSGGARLDRP